MAGKEMDEVEARIAELQTALDDLQHELGRLHETIDLIDPAAGDPGQGTAPAGGASPVIDLRGEADAPERAIDLTRSGDRAADRDRAVDRDRDIDLDAPAHDPADEDSHR